MAFLAKDTGHPCPGRPFKFRPQRLLSLVLLIPGWVGCVARCSNELNNAELRGTATFRYLGFPIV